MKSQYIAPVSVGLVLVLIAVVFGNIFNIIPGSDRLFHFGEGFAIAMFAQIYFINDLKSVSRFKKFLLLTGIVAIYGVLWEFIEYLPRLIPPGPFANIKHYIYGGDLSDTLGDLLADGLGAVVYLSKSFFKR